MSTTLINRLLCCFDAGQRHEALCDALMLRGNERVLDLGAGAGRDAVALAGGCRELTVLGDSRLALRKIPAHPKIRTRCGNPLMTDFADGAFDVVLLSDVMRHTSDQVQLLNEALRILRPGGRLVIRDVSPAAPILRTPGDMAALCRRHHLTPLATITTRSRFLLSALKAE